jgi:hypothetical protein
MAFGTGLRWRYGLDSIATTASVILERDLQNKSVSGCQLSLANNQSRSSSSFLANQTILGGSSLGTS